MGDIFSGLQRGFLGDIQGIFWGYIAGRIVLSHVHVSTLRRTWNIQRLFSTGLASGGIITLE